MNEHTEGDETLLDCKLIVLELDLQAVMLHEENGRRQFAPRVQPIRPVPSNILDCSTQLPVLEIRLRKIRMMLQQLWNAV